MNIHKFNDYLLEKKFNMNITNNYIEILNYLSIDHFDSNLIKIKYLNGIIKIIGNNLIIKRLLKDFIIVKGDIKKIEWLN